MEVENWWFVDVFHCFFLFLVAFFRFHFFVFNSCAPSGGVIQAIQLSLFKAFGRMLLRTWFDFKLTDLLTRAIGMISMDIPWQVCIIMDSGFKIALEDVEIFPSICAW